MVRHRPGVGIQLTKGPHAGRLVVPCDHSTADGVYGSHAIYSDDAGKTWKRGEPILPNVNECQVVELSDGTLLMNMRNYAKSQSRVRAVATSADGGSAAYSCLTVLPDGTVGLLYELNDYGKIAFARIPYRDILAAKAQAD